MTKPLLRYGVVDPSGGGSWSATEAAPSFSAALAGRSASPISSVADAVTRVVRLAQLAGNAETRAMARSAIQFTHRWAELAPERRGRALTPRERAERAAAEQHAFDAYVWLLRRQLEINTQ